jgi:predicted nucleotidyltransferase
MPIKWSALKVSEKADEIEELMNSIRPTLWRMREKAQELRQIPNLPGYIDQPTAYLTIKVDNFNSYMKGYLERMRDRIPKDALEGELKALEYGRQQSLI